MITPQKKPINKNYDVVIIGAGAAGLMCAISAGKRGRRVIVIDHANKVGKKIVMSGGGRCNFTNYFTAPDNFISRNPHFCKSALSRYTQWDFIQLVEKHAVAYHEKKLGQLFCNNKSRDIVNVLLAECRAVNADVRTSVTVDAVKATDSGYQLQTTAGAIRTESLVIATGGLSIPRMGASGFGYDVARQFGLTVLPTSPALVPFTLNLEKLQNFDGLSGISAAAVVSCNGQSFTENILFTHRGLSGPAILQISSYWHQGETVSINLFPDLDLYAALQDAQHQSPKMSITAFISMTLSKALAQRLMQLWCPALIDKRLADCSNSELQQITEHFGNWQLKPNGTEGYRTAEVTLGGVDTDQISSKSFEAKTQPGLYFIGEILDVTGHLGGFNFQWAWASGYACGLYA